MDSPLPRFPTTEEQGELERLSDLQKELLEHTFPHKVSYIPDLLLSEACEIYREMTKKSPDSGNLREKLGGIEQIVIYENGRDWNSIVAEVETGERYESKRGAYLQNLSRLEEETRNASIAEGRKKVMLDALQLQRVMIDWFEGGNRTSVEEQFEKLEEDALGSAV
jgi:hypothetical protein